MDKKILELIAIVHDNYEHIQQLETLATLLEDKYPQEAIVAKTTQNSHYGYTMYTSKELQNPNNHIDKHITIDNEYYHATKRHGTDLEPKTFAWEYYVKNKNK